MESQKTKEWTHFDPEVSRIMMLKVANMRYDNTIELTEAEETWLKEYMRAHQL